MKKPAKVGELAKIFSKIYFDPKNPAGFGSIEQLFRAGRTQNSSITKEDVRRWLRMEDSHTLHRPVQRRFKRRKTIVAGINDQWQIDLVSLQNLRRFNDRFNFLLTGIDVFSRKAFAIPIKTKTGEDVAKALKTQLIKQGPPKSIQSDLGKEFYNVHVAKLLESFNIKLFSVHSDTKASLIERWHRTLMSRLHRYFTKTNTLRYVEALPDLVESYNNRVHRTIGLPPNLVNKGNEKQLWKRLYGKEFAKSASFAFNEGDTVRISQIPRTFEKGYVPQWTREFFTITHRQNTKPPTYKLRDEHGEILQGSFYEQQMQKIQRPDEETAYAIDIIKTRRRNKKPEYLVHWRGWPSSYDQWLPASHLQRI